MTTTTQPTGADLGIGARITLAPMSDNFLTILISALTSTPDDDVTVTSDEISTHVAGTEDAIMVYLRNLLVNVAAHGVHTVAQLTLSRGCPGAVTCSASDITANTPSELTPLAVTGISGDAQWSLYPLLDNVPGPITNHMEPIMAAIDGAKAQGLVDESAHYVTQLHGDLADILNTISRSWIATGRAVSHVVTTATINIAHPTQEEIDLARAALNSEDNR